MADGLDLAYNNFPDEFTTVTPTTSDFLPVYDSSAGRWGKVAASADLAGVTATASEINNVADVSARVQELVASGAVTAGVQSIELNHASTIIAATVAAVIGAHDGILIVKNTSASGTAAHTVTLTGGTWNGTATIITLNAPNEAIMVYFDSAGDGTIIANVGAVALS